MDNLELEYDGIDHVGLIVSNIKAALPFYIDILGFKDDTEALRPEKLQFPGAFMRVGGQQLHLMQIENPDKNTESPFYPGKDRHVAIRVKNLTLLQERLQQFNITYHLSSSGRKAIFCRDFDGNAFEFFEPSESTLIPQDK
jgi:glyoxylase I family protein